MSKTTTQHFFADITSAQRAVEDTALALANIDRDYAATQAALDRLWTARVEAFAKQSAAQKYLTDNQRYHVGDIFENRNGSKYVLSLVIEEGLVFGYLIGLGEAHSGNAGGRWTDGKGPIESSASTECFRSGLTRAQFEKATGRAVADLKLIGSTSTTAEGRPEARGLPRLKLTAVPA